MANKGVVDEYEDINIDIKDMENSIDITTNTIPNSDTNNSNDLEIITKQLANDYSLYFKIDTNSEVFLFMSH